MGAQDNPDYGQNDNMISEGRQRSGFGVMSLTLGIAALATFMMFINIPLAIAAIILGVIQLVGYGPKGYASIGIFFAGLSIVLMIVGWVIIFKGVSDLSEDDVNKLKQQFEEQYQIEMQEQQ